MNDNLPVLCWTGETVWHIAEINQSLTYRASTIQLGLALAWALRKRKSQLRIAGWACYGHTIQNNPDLVRSRKANWIGPDQYYVG